MVTGSPAWKPQATLALVMSSNMAAASPMVQEPKDSPRSAFSSTRTAFREFARHRVRHRPKGLPRINDDGPAHHEVTGTAHHRPNAERQGPSEQGRPLPPEQVSQESFLDAFADETEPRRRHPAGQYVSPGLAGALALAHGLA